MNTRYKVPVNPFRPGAGHMPPFLAGRDRELDEISRLLDQQVILENIVLTGLRGVGKTVLLETIKPKAQEKNWWWVGADLSEAASLTDEHIAIRLLTDIATVTSSLTIHREKQLAFGFTSRETEIETKLDYEALTGFFGRTPGLVSDKLKAVLELVWDLLPRDRVRGIVFAYDEAQNLTDHSERNQYPLSLLLDVFQSLQRKEIPFMLILTGLPTLFSKLIEARTFSERMFHIIVLERLDNDASREAITRPLESVGDNSIGFSDETVETIMNRSGGYPYFLQFICREAFDAAAQRIDQVAHYRLPIGVIILKLDTDFFAGRWSRITDRQRELLSVISSLDDCDTEFTVQEIVTVSRMMLSKGFSPSHTTQILNSLCGAGLVYKNRHGRYSLAVPMLADFIRRQVQQ